MDYDFRDFADAVGVQFGEMSNKLLFKTEVTKDEMWEMYLKAFPDGTNPIYKERTEHDCQCCKQFIRAVGNVVAVDPVTLELMSIWDVELDGYYGVVAAAMSALVKSKPIRDIFLHSEPGAGLESNQVLTEEGEVITWYHFHVIVPPRCWKKGKDIGTLLGDAKSSRDVFYRGLTELTAEALSTVKELIEQNSLYRGEEHLRAVKAFLGCKSAFDKINNPENYVWMNYNLPVARFRNTAIGTLVTDLSDGVDLTDAVGMFESKVAPHNYKRPTALITKSMIANAQAKVEELGILPALSRRHSSIDDITINNVLFADRTAKAEMGGVFDELTASVADKVPNLDKVEEVGIADFMEKILPSADSVELYFENKHTGNLVSLISPQDKEAKSILKWGNNFTWSYNGEVADSMRERVVAAGGRVDGVLRFTMAWNHDGNNQSLMDLHVFMPGYSYNPKHNTIHDRYPSSRRVGWNHRTDRSSGGVQDVDNVSPPGKTVPIENITFPDSKKMPEGVYTFKIHNWSNRSPNTSGFKAEIEFDGTIYEYDHPKHLKNKEWVTLAQVTLKKGKFSINHMLPTTASTKEVWNISTNKFQKVKVIMNSPNHWDGEETGNKHHFFMLEDCLNDGTARGFFNEFLRGDLTEHRKVFEVLGSKMKVDDSDAQLSGLGFSSTQRNQVVCKVKGSFTRMLKINF